MVTQQPDQTAIDLQAIAETIQPDAQFVEALDRRLRQIPMPPKHSLQANRRRFMTGLAAIFIGIVLSFGTVPALRIVALQILDSLFNRASSDTHVFTYQRAVSVTPAPTVQTFAEAQSIVQFKIYQPQAIPVAYELSMISANPAAVYVVYTSPGRYLTIRQQLNSAAWQLNGLVGANAKILKVDIDGMPGEYVEGEWIVLTPIPTPEPSEIVTEIGTWQANVSARRLRWQSGRVLYKVVAQGGSSDIPSTYVGMSEMIAIAKSLH